MTGKPGGGRQFEAASVARFKYHTSLSVYLFLPKSESVLYVDGQSNL